MTFGLSGALKRAAQRTGAQLPAARECTRNRPADARRVDPEPGRPAGWRPGHGDRRRPVSCSALLGGADCSIRFGETDPT